MQSNHRIALFCGIVLLALVSPPSDAADVVFIQNNGSFNSGWTDLMTDLGHTVTGFGSYTDISGNPAQLSALQSADLIMFLRDTDSGNYDDSAAEISAWNGLNTPIILSNPYVSRNSRLKWTDNGSTPSTSGGTMTVTDPLHPIFTGVTVDSSNQLVGSTGSVPAIDVSSNNNGTVLATNGSNSWITYWPTGTEYYSGAVQTAGAPRMFFGLGNGTDESLTANGELILDNAINYVLGNPIVPPPPSPPPVHVVLEAESFVSEGGAGFSVLADAGASLGNYATTATNGSTPDNTATYDVTFIEPGDYALYARVLVESNSANNDSFFAPDGFGTNPDITVNNIAGNGDDWLWINLFTGSTADGADSFTDTVPLFNVADAGTFQFTIGGREDGFWIDKFVFSTENNLNSEQLDGVVTTAPSAVPEPSTFVLAAFGLLGLAFFGWRKRK